MNAPAERAATRRSRRRQDPLELKQEAERRWGWLAKGAIALVGLLAMTVAQTETTQRTIAVVLVAGAVLVLGVRTETGVRVALLILPFMGLVRRVSGGADAYVLNDPLVLLTTAVMLPAAVLLPRRLLSPKGRPYVLLAAWLLMGEGLGILQGLSIQTAIYGAATAVIPVLIGAKIATGLFGQLAHFLVRTLPPAGALVGLYGLYQWISPPTWDLSWLRTQQAALTSVGYPEVGQFRIWATTESPGIAALVLGAAACVALPIAIRLGTPPMQRLFLLLELVPILFTLVLTEARTGLFAIPFAVGVTVLLDRNVRKVAVLPALAVLVAVAVIVPPLLSTSTTEQARYNVANISEDQSFRDRQQLLPIFAQTVASRPLGTGSGSTQLGQRLAGSGSTTGGGNIDNGYLTRLIETGIPGLALFMVIVLGAIRAVRRRWQSQRPIDAVGIGCIAVVMFFLLTDVSGPSTNGSISILFWVCLGHLARIDAVTNISDTTSPQE